LPLVFRDPALGDLVNRHRVQEVQLLSTPAGRRNEVGLFEAFEVLRDGLPRHVEVSAEIRQ
jgi:hypothetical protein